MSDSRAILVCVVTAAESYICARCNLLWRGPRDDDEARLWAAEMLEAPLSEVSIADAWECGFDCPGCGHSDASRPINSGGLVIPPEGLSPTLSARDTLRAVPSHTVD